MNASPPENSLTISSKIARLVEERGWNQEEFARRADLNRLTVRQILQGGNRRLRNATVSACARALGLSVSELRDLPLPELLARMHAQDGGSPPPAADERLRRIYEMATQPELAAWVERNPEQARQLTAEEMDELLSLQGTGGHLTSYGLQHFLDVIARKRRVKEQVDTIAGTEYLDLLEKLVGLIYEKIQPYRDRL